MDRAAAEAAGGQSFGELVAVSAALDVLRARVGHLITADEPGELDRLVADDLGPVAR